MSSMMAMLIRVTLIFAIFVNYANCETDQEFRDMILQKVADQDEKNQKQDEKIQQLETENTVLKLKLESYQSQFQENLDIANAKIEVSSLMSVPNSCFELWQHGVTSSQTLALDFDGKGRGSMPIVVNCDFYTNATKVGDAKMINFQDCDTNACDEQKVIENEEILPQVLALIDSSASCSQTIQFDCILAPLHVSLRYLKLLKYLKRGWISKDSNIETPMKI